MSFDNDMRNYHLHYVLMRIIKVKMKPNNQMNY